MGQDQVQPQPAQEQLSAEAREKRGRYDGECDDLGRPHGKGKMFYASDESTFEGEFKAGRRDRGKLLLKNGDYYDGFFNEDS